MYAIPNCGTVKKARAFLETNSIDYEFVDFKKTPPTKKQIAAWEEYLGELPVNKKGTTYRKHKDHYEALSQSEKADFIIANPSIIKRPVLIQNSTILAIGFSEEQYKTLITK